MVRYRLQLTTTPPSLPPHPQPQAPPSSRWKIPLIILASLVGLVLVIIGIGVLFVLTARDFTPTEDQKAAVVTANYLAEWFDIEPEERGETWECKRYLDGSKEIFYLYYHEYITLDCTLTIGVVSFL